MQEPTTASAFLAVMCAIGVVSGVDAYAVVISSFAGATLYMITSQNISIGKRWVCFVLSFFVGITTSNTVGKLLTSFAPENVIIDQSIAALLSSALFIKLLMWVMENKRLWELLFKQSIRYIFKFLSSKKGGR